MLSVSTAGKNRYLFHFNSLHSLTQWTAGIRLSMFEHATLQEAYTGSLIAGKGKALNNIRVIMERTKLKTEDWTRVRFGAGTPWRRCWCVITPPDEKEVQKLQKSLKKKSAYDRVIPTLKGNVKFYDTKRVTKKVQPIATINDAYSAYAIYPQSKPLIDQSTLVKVEGNITIHSAPETTMEGFVFVMPETHPAVSGFEMMLRWLFPLYDIFALYGRPNRLIADTRNTQSLMFALPQERRYGYLEILDVASLIHESGSQNWNEREWRSRLKELSLTRINRLESTGSRQRSRASSYRGHRNSLPSRTGTLRYDDSASIRSSPSFHNEIGPPSSAQKPGSAPPGESPFQPPGRAKSGHHRSVSDIISLSTPRHRPSQRSNMDYTPSKLNYEAPQTITPSESPPPVPAHDGYGFSVVPNPTGHRNAVDADGVHDRSSSESERRLRGQVDHVTQDVRQEFPLASPVVPVVTPPAFAHEAGAKPARRPHVSPELRRANSRMSISTLNQLAAAGQLSSESSFTPSAAPAAPNPVGIRNDRSFLETEPSTVESNGIMGGGDFVEDNGPRGVNDRTSKLGTTADHIYLSKGKASVGAARTGAQSSHLSDHLDQHGRGFTADYQQQPPVSAAPMPLSRNARSLSQNYSDPNTLSFAQQEQYPHYDPELIPNQEFSGRYSQYSPASKDRTLPNPPDRQSAEMKRVSTAFSIPRKPVPSLPPSQVSAPASPTSSSSLESLRQHVVDEQALDQFIARNTDQPYRIDSYYEMQTSEGDSIHDNDSNISPDYASTRKSTETKRSKSVERVERVERPRIGVLKTVGTVEPVPDESTMKIRAALPEVDFGPTHVYSQGIGKRSAQTASTQESFDPVHRLTPSPRSHSPADPQSGGEKRAQHERSPSRNLATSESGRRTPSSASVNDNQRNVVWQPGTAIGGGSPSGRQVITPEQFVQQRAAANRVTPVYAHGRKASEQRAPPTVFSRSASGEWPLQQHARQASSTRELPTRPHSRGASTIMGPSGELSTPLSAALSAREQEHVARATGSPLIHMAGNPNRNGPHGGGLIGAIEAREKEKRDMKEGLSGHLVQQAIAQRQQYNHSYQNNQQSFPSPSPQMPMPGQWPQTPNMMQQQYIGTPPLQQPGQFSPQKFMPSQQQRQQPWNSSGSQYHWNASQASSPYVQQQHARQNSSMGQQQQPGSYQQQGSYYQQGAYQQQQGSYQQQQGGAYQQQQGPYQQQQQQQQGSYQQQGQQQQHGSYFGGR